MSPRGGVPTCPGIEGRPRRQSIACKLETVDIPNQQLSQGKSGDHRDDDQSEGNCSIAKP
jgi:hypothetical protein